MKNLTRKTLQEVWQNIALLKGRIRRSPNILLLPSQETNEILKTFDEIEQLLVLALDNE